MTKPNSTPFLLLEKYPVIEKRSRRLEEKKKRAEELLKPPLFTKEEIELDNFILNLHIFDTLSV
jgi:hypothetical protein